MTVGQTLLGHTKRRLTTKALAAYILRSSGHGHLLRNHESESEQREGRDDLENGSLGSSDGTDAFNGTGRVLFLSGNGKPDYVRDLTLHGGDSCRL